MICYGGSVGKWDVDNIYATGLASGGYYGFIGTGGAVSYSFRPNEFVRIDGNVSYIRIDPPF